MFDHHESTITAVLGPTNTGKTHFALERMLGRESGIIGLPLRLLAREIYDKLVALRGANAISLITGEEKIAPPQAKFHVCTVEAMPLDIRADFVAIDEIQLCADPDRGHIFTDRLLHARGRYETMFLGSDTIRPRIANLVPKARFDSRVRFSTLSWAGSKKISRLRPRTAVVAFSVDQVYAIAELIRRQRGGAAVVMGALSPRTRNAQVALYQEGDVDYMVATDAIGMGLNMDVDHVAFAGVSKFDGHRTRALMPNELAQIAGRAGRFTKDGTFGVTGEAHPLDPEVVDAIENHRFKPLEKLMWRNSELQYGTVEALLRSLDVAPEDPDLVRAREAEDQVSLRTLWEDPEIREMATRGDRVRLLWDVCQTPDFRKVSPAEHAALLSRIYRFLLEDVHCIPSAWMASQVGRLDRVDGDIDALSKRLAYIRTWTYVANRPGWVEDAAQWQGETRAVEDRLSDALHDRLTQRFVDRRTSVLMRRLKQKERLLAEVNDKGEVTAEGQFLGRMSGFRFTVDETASGDELKTLKSASLSALQAEFAKRADKLYLSPDTEIDVTDQGGLMWGTDAVGRVTKGEQPLEPKISVFVDEMAEPAVSEKVERRLRHWLLRRINAQFEPLVTMRDDEAITGLARGVAFQLVEHFGVIPRRQIAEDVKALAQEERALLRKHGVRFGQHFIFMPALLKPAPTRLRLLLWSIQQDLEEFGEAPPPGHVTIPAEGERPHGYYEMAGYRKCGSRAVRIDMLERLADMIRPMDVRGGFEATQDMLSITGCTLEQFADLMSGLGYVGERGERPKSERPKPELGQTEAKPDDAAEADSGSDADASGGEAASAGDAPQPDEVADEAATTSADPETAESAALPTSEADAAGSEDTTDSGSDAETSIADAAAADAPAEAQPFLKEAQPGEPTEAVAETPDAPAAETSADADAASSDADEPPAKEAAVTEASESDASGDTPASDETEVFFIFKLKPRGRPQGRGGRPFNRGRSAQPGDEGDGQRGDRPRGKGKPRRDQQAGGGGADGGKSRGEGFGKGKGGKKPRRDDKKSGPRVHSAGPKKENKQIDPDNPFAVLQQLKNR
ncbi:MAG: helicase-related protein [Pseudomonadota bacterium]